MTIGEAGARPAWALKHAVPLTRPRLFTVSSSSKSAAAAGIEVGIGTLTHSHSHLTRFLFSLSLTGFVSFLAPPLAMTTTSHGPFNQLQSSLLKSNGFRLFLS
ncbi:hypothetical protein QL285_017674 [Trifolium repens]|nr:hypothetical protein QL285_017674 [Trifolium repens]